MGDKRELFKGVGFAVEKSSWISDEVIVHLSERVNDKNLKGKNKGKRVVPRFYKVVDMPCINSLPCEEIVESKLQIKMIRC